MMNNTKEILQDMRNLTMVTGEISSVHEQSLKKWPYVAFDGVTEAEIDYDLTENRTKEVGEGFVDFKLTVEPMAENKLLKERCDTVTNWVRGMFWQEIRVKVYFNDVCQYTNSSLEE